MRRMWQSRELEKEPYLLHLLLTAPGSNVLEDLGPDSFYIHERVYPLNTFTIYGASVQVSVDCNQKEACLSTLYPVL